MESVTMNPYPSFSKDISDGLNSIQSYFASHQITHPTENDLNDALVAYIQGKFSYDANDALGNVELNSYLSIAVNAYTNNEMNIISSGQAPFVVLLLEKIKDVPPLQILDYLASVEEQIAESGLSLPEQNQLFMATAVAASLYKYWLTQINAPPANASPWAPYMDANIPVNIANLPYWITAAIQAALYFCFKGNYVTNSKEPPKISGPDYVTVLTTSIGIAAGKVIFNWIQNIRLESINSTMFHSIYINSGSNSSPIGDTDDCDLTTVSVDVTTGGTNDNIINTSHQGQIDVRTIDSCDTDQIADAVDTSPVSDVVQ